MTYVKSHIALAFAILLFGFFFKPKQNQIHSIYLHTTQFAAFNP